MKEIEDGFLAKIRDNISEDLDNIGLDEVHRLEKIYGRTDLRVKKAKLESFFKAYAILGTVRYSCQVCGLKADVIKQLVNNHDKYKRRFEEAHNEFCEYLEQTAVVRALRKSDTLLTFLLRANNPHKFSERLRLQAMTDPQDGPVELIFGEGSGSEVTEGPVNFLREGEDDRVKVMVGDCGDDAVDAEIEELDT